MTLSLVNGQLDTNSQTVTIGKGGFVSNGSATRVLTLGSSAISIGAESFSHMSYWLSAATGLTVAANTAVVTVQGVDGRTFTAPGTNWNGMSLVITAGSTLTLSAAGATFGNVTRSNNDPTGGLKISGSFTVAGNLTFSSTVASLTISSFAPGTPYVITYGGTKTDSPNVIYSGDITTASSGPIIKVASDTLAVRGVDDAAGPAMAYRSMTKSADGTLSVSKPAGVVAGDLLALFFRYGFDMGGPGTFTPPTGFTQQSTVSVSDGSTSTKRFIICTRIANGTEPATFTVGMTNDYLGQLHCVAFTNGGEYVTTTSIGYDYDPGGSTTSLVVPSITVPEAGSALLFLVHGSQNPSLPAGMTSIDADFNYRVAYELVGAGATGTRTTTFADQNSIVAMMLAVVPARVSTAAVQASRATTETLALTMGNTGVTTVVGQAKTAVETLAARVIDASVAPVVVGLVKTAVDTLTVTIANVGSVYAPNVTAELWEAGVFVATLGNYSALTETVLSIPFGSTLLADPSGADVEIRLTGVSADIGAVEWNATYSSIVVGGDIEEPVLVESWGFIQM